MNFVRCFIGISLIIMIGCSTIGDRRRMDILEILTDRYESALRWGQYETAVAMIDADPKERGMTGPDDLKNIKITSYRLINKSISESREEAKQRIEIKYYEIDNMIEKTLIDDQTWTYDKDVKSWFLSSGLPDFQ